MNLKKLLLTENMLPMLKADTKHGVIEELIGFLAGTGKIKNPGSALQAVLEREEKMSTGMQNGIAIPHGKTDAVDELQVAVAIKRDGVDFDCMDGQPAKIFIMTLSPESRVGPHIQFLAEISKLLSRPDLREQLTACATADEMLKLLTN